MESLASYHGPEPCAGDGNAAGEALTGGNAGQPLSSEITTLGVPTGLTGREGHAGRRVRRERRPGPTELKTLACAETQRNAVPVTARRRTERGHPGGLAGVCRGGGQSDSKATRKRFKAICRAP